MKVSLILLVFISFVVIAESCFVHDRHPGRRLGHYKHGRHIHDDRDTHRRRESQERREYRERERRSYRR